MGACCSKNASEHVFDLLENVAYDMICRDPTVRAKLQAAYEKYDKFSRIDQQKIDKMMMHVLQQPVAPTKQVEPTEPAEPPKLVRQNAVEQL